MPDKFIIDPDADLDFSVDWTAWMATGDTISASSWAITPTGPTLGIDTFGATSATVWVSGATVATTYELTNSITTADGRQDDRTISLYCEQR